MCTDAWLLQNSREDASSCSERIYTTNLQHVVSRHPWVFTQLGHKMLNTSELNSGLLRWHKYHSLLVLFWCCASWTVLCRWLNPPHVKLMILGVPWSSLTVKAPSSRCSPPKRWWGHLCMWGCPMREKVICWGIWCLNEMTFSVCMSVLFCVCFCTACVCAYVCARAWYESQSLVNPRGLLW